MPKDMGRIFFEAPFVIARNYKATKCPPAVKWIHKSPVLTLGDTYRAMEMNELQPHVITRIVPSKRR